MPLRAGGDRLRLQELVRGERAGLGLRGLDLRREVLRLALVEARELDEGAAVLRLQLRVAVERVDRRRDVAARERGHRELMPGGRVLGILGDLLSCVRGGDAGPLSLRSVE